MNFFKKRPLFWRYVLLFSQAVVLPVCLVSVSLVHMSNALKYEINQTQLSAVSLVQKAADANFQGLEDSVNTIRTSPELTRELLAQDPESAMHFLQNLVSSHRSLENIFLTIRDDPTIYTATGVFSTLNRTFNPCIL